MYIIVLLLLISTTVQCETENNPLTNAVCNYTLNLLKGFKIDINQFNSAEWCPYHLDAQENNRSPQDIERLVDQINSTYIELRRVVDALSTKVSPYSTIISNQSYESIKIVDDSGFLIIPQEPEDIDGSSILFPSYDGIWNTNQVQGMEKQTSMMLDDLESYHQIVLEQVVWFNGDEIINGSCCMIANITYEPSQHIIVNDLTIKKDSDDVYLDSDITWGFISLDDVDKNIAGTVNFDSKIAVNTLESPSVNLKKAVLMDHESVIIRGHISFSQLEIDSVNLNHEYELNNQYNLMTIVNINDTMPYHLNYLDFDQVNADDINDSVISGINLNNLLLYDSVQSFNKSFFVQEVELYGPSCTDGNEFVPKLMTKLMEFVNSTESLNYNQLVFESTINITNLYTDLQNDWMFFNTNETINLDTVQINGNVNFLESINGFKLENLVHVEDTISTEEIESEVIIDGKLVIPDDLAHDLFGHNFSFDNWVIKGDLIVNQEFNKHLWRQLIQDIVSLDEKIDQLEFAELVKAVHCNFGSINDNEIENLVNLDGNDKISSPLAFKYLDLLNLTLEGWNLSSCLTKNGLGGLIGTKDYPIDVLDVISLDVEGKINEILPKYLMLNGSNQDLIVPSPLLLSNVTFNIIEMENLYSTKTGNVDVKQINKILMHKLLREQRDSKWPEALIIKECNMTNLINIWMNELISNILTKNGNQTILTSIEFMDDVSFGDDVKFKSKNLTINFPIENNVDFSSFVNLTINGDLIALSRLHVLSKWENATLTQGITMREPFKAATINSSNGIIYENSTWKVYQQSTLLESESYGDLLIDGNLKITDEQANPWLTPGSLKGLEFYSDVTFEDLSINLTKNCSYDQLRSDTAEEIKLEDIATIPDELLDVEFTQDMNITENITTESDVFLSNVTHDEHQFNWINSADFSDISADITFNDTVLMIGDLN